MHLMKFTLLLIYWLHMKLETINLMQNGLKIWSSTIFATRVRLKYIKWLIFITNHRLKMAEKLVFVPNLSEAYLIRQEKTWILVNIWWRCRDFGTNIDQKNISKNFQIFLDTHHMLCYDGQCTIVAKWHYYALF